MHIALLIIVVAVLGGLSMAWLQFREGYFISKKIIPPPVILPGALTKKQSPAPSASIPFLSPASRVQELKPSLLPLVSPAPTAFPIIQEQLKVITSSTTLQPASIFDTPGTAFGIFLANQFAYVADGDNGLAILHISPLTQPRLRSVIKTKGPAHGVLVAGFYAYVAIYEAGLEVINIIDPDNPFSVMVLPTPGYTKNLAIEGTMLYASNYQNGVLLVDINDPMHPYVRGTYLQDNMLVKDIAPFGDVIFVADAGLGLIVLDVSDQSKPTLITTKKTNGSPMGITRAGYMLFIADETAGVTVFDAHNPRNPVFSGTYQTAGLAKGVVPFNSESFLAVASFHEDIALLLDISDPRNPRRVSAYHPFGRAHRVAVSDSRMAIADDKDGVVFFDLSVVSH